MINVKKQHLSVVISVLASAGAANAWAQSEAPRALEEVVVSGIRQSIEAAQDVKRDATGVVDVVTSEDLGKFTDDNIGAAIARIPGVQIQRNDNGIGGDRASIRGMGPLFVNTTVNGRTPLSHGDEGIGNIRQFNLDVIPAEIVSGVVVRKMPTAETIEGGIGGSIELQTIQALDAESLYQTHDNVGGVVSLSGVHDSLTEEWSPKFSGVLGLRNSDNTVAAYLSMVLSDADYAVDEIYTRAQERDIKIDTTGNGSADYIAEDVISHSRITMNAIRGEKERESFSYGVQWQASDDLKLGIDGYNSTYNVYSQRPTVDLFFDYNGVFDKDAINIDNNFVQQVDGSGVTEPGGDFKIENFDLLFDNLSDNSVIGINATYGEYTDFTLSADVSYSKVEFEQDLRLGIMGAYGLDPADFRYDGTGDIPSFTYGEEVNDVESYNSVGFFGRDRRGNNEQLALRLDADFELTEGVRIKVGARHANSEIDVRETGRFTLLWDDEALNSASFDGSLTEELFPGEGIGFNQFLMVDYDAQAEVYPEIFNERAAESTITSPLLSVVDEQGLPLDRANSFVVEEETLAFYVQADLEGQVGPRRFTANAGVRTVATDRSVQGFQTVRIVNSLNAVVEELGFVGSEVDSDDFQVLPSANFMFEVADNMQWRVGVAKTMSQPEYTDLKVNGSINLQDVNDTGYDSTINSTAEIGNPDLNPYTAWSFDTTFEYYLESGGAVFASLFYKDVSDFVLREARTDVAIDGYDQLFDTTQPINVAKGQVQGFEVGANIPMGDFGLQANYTFVDSEFDNPDNNPLLDHGFPGSSKNNFNAIGYYEVESFSARLAYIYRDDYFQALGGGFDRANQPAFAEGSGQLDVNLSYDLLENVQVTLDISNVTEENARNYINESTNFRDYVTRPRTTAVGVRATF
ncbi:TonB-dependent receptor [Gilvimarinus chinensis]|uniref:TonB-dependent receptor n=1 Tax=Gilvimarinus chinensis TaxID=396005 RepID=UPI000363AE55|nr:TonB-dependent receptor [Gilvimarinus chinensis]